MLKRGLLFLFCLVLLSCSSDNKNRSKVDKEYYDNGRLKSIIYHFKNNDIKKVSFTHNGTLNYIHNYSNNGHDNFMFIFDDKGRLWMIVPHKNDSLNGKVIYFDDKGQISSEEEYLDGNLLE